MEAGRLANLHAYVDDCLAPDERRAFEQQMAEDPTLARCAAAWRAQNGAIRSAFEVEGARAFSISLVRPVNESPGKGRRSTTDAHRHQREKAARFSASSAAGAYRIAPHLDASRRVRPRMLWRLGLAAMSLALICFWSPKEPANPANRLGEAGVAAFRAFANSGVGPVEFATDDVAQSQKWLATRLSRPVYLPATPSGFSLLGVRVAPSPGAAAALLVYKMEQKFVGLMVQSLDSPTSRPPELLRVDGRFAAVWTAGGQGFALVGDTNPRSLLQIALDFFDPPSRVRSDRA